MAYQHSRDAVVKIDNAAGSLTTITSYVDSVSFDQNPEQQDVTVMGSQDRQYLAGFVSNQFTMGGKQDYADDAIYDIIATATGSATTRTWELAPEGTGSGAVKYTGECLVLASDISITVDAPQTWTATCRITGDVTKTTY